MPSEQPERSAIIIKLIERIYTKAGYTRTSRTPLSKFTLEQLETHLKNLLDNKIPWVDNVS